MKQKALKRKLLAVSDDLWRKAKAHAANAGVTISAWVRDAIQAKMKEAK